MTFTVLRGLADQFVITPQPFHARITYSSGLVPLDAESATVPSSLAFLNRFRLLFALDLIYVSTTKTYTYNAENRLVSATGTQFVYDADGGRVKQTVGASTTTFIGDLIEVAPDSTVTKYIFAGDQRIAAKTSSAYRFYHGDHLGSTSVITDLSGSAVERIVYKPYGATYSDTGTVSVPQKFTGQRLDGTGLYFYNARYYDPQLGRFTQPDSIVQNPSDPQTLNRYSYCRNNPLRYVDPTGYKFSLKKLFQVVAIVAAVVASVATIVVTAGTATPGVLEAWVPFATTVANVSSIAGGVSGIASLATPSVAQASEYTGPNGRSMNPPSGVGVLDHPIETPMPVLTPNPIAEPAHIVVGDPISEPYTGTIGDSIPDAPRGGIIDNTPPETVGQMYNALDVSDTPKPTEDVGNKPADGGGQKQRSPKQDKKLSKQEVDKLKKAGIDPEGLKGGRGTGGIDLYKDREGNVLIKPKDGSGPGEPTGINVKRL